MTSSDLDEIRKRCEARGSDAVPDAFRDRLALLEEVERLNRIDAAPPRCSGCSVELGDPWCAKCATEAERDRLQAEVERLQRENEQLRLRPPMSCIAREDHNQELADKNRALQDENDELRDAISDEAAATLADRNEIRRHMHAVMDALVFATDPINMNIDYETAGARTEALVEEVKRLRTSLAESERRHQHRDLCDETNVRWNQQRVQRSTEYLNRARTAEQRLALLEPVWEAAKVWRDSTQLKSELLLRDAIDAAVAKEGK